MEFFIFLSVICGISLTIIFLSKPDFSRRKVRLMHLYSSLISDMNLDFKSADIGAINISEISKSILNFSNEIEVMSKMAKDQSKEDQKWLLDIVEEFSSHLQLWIDRHESELTVVENTIEGIETQDA